MKQLFKNIIIAVAAVAITGLTSCQSDNDGQDNPSKKEQTAMLNIQLNNPTHTKVADSVPYLDSVILNLNIFVLDENNEVAWTAYIDENTDVSEDATPFEIEDITDEPYIMEVSTKAKYVYAIANAGADLTEDYADSVALHTATIDLETQYVSRWATGSEVVGEFSTDAIPTVDVDMTLRFLAARIVVGGAITSYEYTDPDLLNINNVTLLNARAQSLLFPNAQGRLIPPTYDLDMKYYEGMDNPGGFKYWTGTDTYTLYDAPDYNNADFVSAIEPTPDGSFSPVFFYVFENDAITAETFPTIVTFRGVDADDNAVYFPIHLATYETWADEYNEEMLEDGILRGNSYNLDVYLNVDPAAVPIGQDDPTEHIVKAMIDITVTVNDWVTDNFYKVF